MSIRGIERDEGCKTVAPIGDVFQKFGIGCGLGFDNIKVRHDRACIRKRLAFVKTDLRGAPIERVYSNGISDLDRNDDGFLR